MPQKNIYFWGWKDVQILHRWLKDHPTIAPPPPAKRSLTSFIHLLVPAQKSPRSTPCRRCSDSIWRPNPMLLPSQAHAAPGCQPDSLWGRKDAQPPQWILPNRYKTSQRVSPPTPESRRPGIYRWSYRRSTAPRLSSISGLVSSLF